MDTVRLRVVFEDRHLLTKLQKSEGLKRSWLLLKPHHETISDLTSYLAHIFDLHHSCPNGIVLSMDGFALPPFESTCILKDKDVISVKRKGGKLCEVGDVADLIEEEAIVEKQPVITSVPLLANEEFEKETGGYETEPEEGEDNKEIGGHRRELEEDGHTLLVENSSGGNAVSKKRKASKKLQSPERKKKRTTVPEDIESEFPMDQNESGDIDGLHDKEEKLSDTKSKTKRASTSRSAERDTDIVEPSSSSKRSVKLQENGPASVHVPQTPNGTKKVPSRSARRQYSKRRWLRELKAELKELEKDVPDNYVVHQEQNQNGEAGDEIALDDEIVPVVIRPGHIRFEPLGKDAGQAVQQSLASMDTCHWNGITSKKKGQKWGTQKFASSRRNDDKASNKECSEMVTNDEVKHPNDPIDFDRLAPLNRLPQEGEVIAYRLVELSTTWSPKLSSLRIGKTSWCDPRTKRILLTPLAEYPINFDKQPDEDGWAPQQDNSPYGEDGSLEISFMSLIDVRIVNHGIPVPAKAASGWLNKAPTGNETTTWNVIPSNNYKQTHASTPESEASVWDKHVQAQSAKKAQVIHVNRASKDNSGTRSCSDRDLRNSVLGPRMALPRARNGR